MENNGLIDPILINNIEEKLKKVTESISYYSGRKRLIEEGLRSIGDVHSFWIENPQLRMTLLRTGSLRTQKEARKGIGAIKNSWYYLTTSVQPNVLDGLNEENVKKTNRILTDPWRSNGDTKECYRDKSVTLGFNDYSPPKHQDVPGLIQELFGELRSKERGKLELAIYAHLRLAGIQPFMDGNKRTARLVQDAILVQSGYPPAVIYSGEGTFYFNLLHEALAAYSNDKIIGQRGFYDFIATKVNGALDEIIGDLDVDSPEIH
jgi:hypothetical protein